MSNEIFEKIQVFQFEGMIIKFDEIRLEDNEVYCLVFKDVKVANIKGLIFNFMSNKWKLRTETNKVN